MKLTTKIFRTLIERGYSKRVKKLVEANIRGAHQACGYARFILKGRFPEGEAAMNKSSYYFSTYQVFLQSLR